MDAIRTEEIRVASHPGSEFFFPEEFRPSHYLVW